MGKGRDKRKKHEDPAKAAKRASKQAAKLQKNEKRKDGEEGDGGPQAASSSPGGLNNEESVEVMVQKIRRAEEKEKRKTTVEREVVLPPSPRANVVIAAHPNREHELLIFGGELWNGVVTTPYNDLFIYNVLKKSWSQVICPVTPAPRSSAQGVTYKQYLLIYGGEFVSPSQSQFMHFRDVWRYDSNCGQWEELKNCVKRGPSARSGHRMVLWRKNAVMFGGFYDNALECRYYNDLWVLSDMDTTGRWTQIEVPESAEMPHARSGHCMGIYNDQLFVYGGYSAEKFNRFKKTEATVHHDLWMISLNPPASGSLHTWQKIRLSGIPPPIRSGVSCAQYNKKFLLFGGVVDIETSGGKLASTFHNDIFEFHMDSQRFYPLVLRKPSAKSAAASSSASTKAKAEGGGNTLAAELAALNLKNEDEEEEEQEEDDDDELAAEDRNAPVEASKFSYEHVKGSPEQIVPHRRMDASLVVVGNTLYVFGGQFEAGKKEVTISDLFSLNLNQMNTFVVHHAQNLAESQWLGKDDDSDDANSWESGSTVLSANLMDLDDHDDDDDDEDEENALGIVRARHTDPARVNDDDDDDECPQVVPADIGHEATPGGIPSARAGGADGPADFRKTAAKRGLQSHKQQLQCQLSAESTVPTPLVNENLRDFFARTEPFWLKNASDALFGNAEEQKKLSPMQGKRCRSEAMKFARIRFDDAAQLVEQLRLIEEREKEEVVLFQQLREQRRKAALPDAADGSDDDGPKDERPKLAAATVAASASTAPLKSALKKYTPEPPPPKVSRGAQPPKHDSSSDDDDEESLSTSSDDS